MRGKIKKPTSGLKKFNDRYELFDHFERCYLTKGSMIPKVGKCNIDRCNHGENEILEGLRRHILRMYPGNYK